MTQAAVVCTRTRRRLMRSSIVDRRRLSRANLVATRARMHHRRGWSIGVRTFGGVEFGHSAYTSLLFMSRARRSSSSSRAYITTFATSYALCLLYTTRTHTHTALARRPVRAPCSRSDCRSVGPPTPTPHPRVRIMPAQGLASRVDRRIARSAFVDDDDDGARRGRVASRRHPR